MDIRRLHALLPISAAALGIAACSPEPVREAGASRITEFQHRFAIDMRKVHQKVPKYRNSPRFVAVSPEQLLPSEQTAPLRPKVCEYETRIGANGETSQGGCYSWGLMQTRNFDHSRHVDAPATTPIVNIIDDDGNKVDPPGYMNIIPLLAAERHEQKFLRETLKNGDILVFFHPEDDDVTQYTMHHAAMYYDTGDGPLLIEDQAGVPYVHHVDNPTSYGPSFNSGISSTPFHVYRFSPNGAPSIGGRDAQGRYQFPCNDAIRDESGPQECQEGKATFTITDDMAKLYGYMSRNWALLTNEHMPFADFHNLTWSSYDQLENNHSSFQAEIDRFARPAVERGETPEVYCAGMVFSNLTLGMNRPMGRRGLGDLYDKLLDAEVEFNDGYMEATIDPNGLIDDEANLPRLGQYPFDPITASDIVDFWLDGYYGGRRYAETSGSAGMSPRERAMILQGAAEQLAGGFSQLEWTANKPLPEGSDNSVASIENINRYAQALAAGPEQLAELKRLERENVDNRYTPPFGYHLIASRENSVLSYVATVVHIGMLTCIDPNGCADAEGSGAKSFMQGGPDSSLYGHYKVPNGGRHTQRIFAVDSGPTKAGPGSWVSTRISASDITDVKVLLHPPSSFTPFTGAEALYACERNATCLGETIRGIELPLSPALANGETAWKDVNVKFNLFTPRAEGGLGCDIETRTCPASDGGDPIDVSAAFGQWTLTMMDLGQKTAGVEITNCAECTTGGGHSNQWVLQIRDDDPSAVVPGLTAETEPNDTHQQATALGALPAARAGNLTGDADKDYYVFELATSARVRVSTGYAQEPVDQDEEQQPAGVDTLLTLYRANGTTKIGEDDDGAGVASFSQIDTEEPLAAGRYYVMVTGYSGAEGEYAVRVQTLTGGAAAGE